MSNRKATGADEALECWRAQLIGTVIGHPPGGNFLVPGYHQIAQREMGRHDWCGAALAVTTNLLMKLALKAKVSLAHIE